MSRPTSIRRETIVAAAQRMFLKDGYDVSTAAIAREVGCSEGTIFKRFKTKEALFLEAMGIPELELEGRLEGLVGNGVFTENLTELCVEIIDFLRVLVPRVMRLWAHETANPLSFAQRKRGPHFVLKQLTNYFAAEMEIGRIRDGDPEVLARILIGSLHNYVFMELVGVHTRMPMPPQTYARGLIDMLWSGLAPETVRLATGTDNE